MIHCDAMWLRNALAATACADDRIISISIPHDKSKPIAIAASDVQVIVLPIRINDERYGRRFVNWYKPIGGSDE